MTPSRASHIPRSSEYVVSLLRQPKPFPDVQLNPQQATESISPGLTHVSILKSVSPAILDSIQFAAEIIVTMTRRTTRDEVSPGTHHIVSNIYGQQWLSLLRRIVIRGTNTE